MLSQNDEMKIRREILDEKECKLIIKYEIKNSEDEIYCIPVEIKPEGLSMGDYRINFNQKGKKIETIVNKNFGRIEFKAIELGNEIGGYIFGSKM